MAQSLDLQPASSVAPDATAPRADTRVCVGVVAGAHGIRGGVKIKSFTAEPEDVGAYGPVEDEGKVRRWTIRVTGAMKGVVLARLEGITTRDAAEALKGARLYVDRSSLPPPDEEEFYHADLIGLRADLTDGGTLGTVAALWDFGAGTSIEIETPDGGSIMLPFTREAVPVIEIAAGRVVIEPPPGLFDKPEPPASVEDQAAMAAEVLGRETP